MYTKYEGSEEMVLAGLTMHIPPVGYGIREERDIRGNHTYYLEETDIIGGDKHSGKLGVMKQKWEERGLPDWYVKTREQEAESQEANPKHFNKKCEDFRKQEWGRRKRGVWFWNKGRLVYITGVHYTYLKYGILPDGPPPLYRKCDRLWFYMWRYCEIDPNCLGMINVTKRKGGKTAKGTWIVLDYCSMYENVHGGMQSKTDDDAIEVFQKGIVQPWKQLPHFFRPIYNVLGGDTPDDELRFFESTKRGQNAGTKEDKFQFVSTPMFGLNNKTELKSWIEQKASGVQAFNGPHLHRYYSDEDGKLKLADIGKRQKVVRLCSYINGKFLGKHLHTTTAEDMDDGGDRFKKLWENSNQQNKQGRRLTGSYLYQYFEPGYEIDDVDEYGDTDEMENIARINDERANSKANDSISEYFSVIRSNPFSIEEAFKFTNSGGHYNNEKILTQLDALELDESLELGNLVWENNIPYTKVIWRPSSNGRWLKLKGCEKYFIPNNVQQRGKFWYPLNKTQGCGAFDPFSHSEVKDGRGSLCAATAKFRRTLSNPHPMNGMFFLLYHSRPATVTQQHEDLLKMAWWLGMEMLGETNKNAWIEYFTLMNCRAFLMRLPGEREPGIAGTDKSAEDMMNLIEEEVDLYIGDNKFPIMLNQWKDFEFKNRTPYDIHMASGYNCIGEHKLVYLEKRTTNVPLEAEDFYPQHPIAG